MMGYVPPVPAPGVPLSTPVPGLNVTPVGNVPVSLNVGLGMPVAVTVNVPAVPTVKVVLFALVITGAVFTVSVKLCIAGEPTPFDAVNVMGYVPAVPAPGVPLSTPVAAVNVTPVGSVPVSLRVGVGLPVVVTVNVPAVPTTNVTLLALVIAAAWLTVSVNWPEVVDFAPPALESVTVTVKLNVPALPAGGVPERIPAALMESQEGRPVALQLSAPEPPVAANVKV